MTDTVWLQRASYDVPWGFRITGGRDYQKPLSVQRVTGGSVASTGLHEGDVILRISDTDTSTLTQAHANELIKGCGNLLQLSILRQDGRQGSGHSQVAAKSPGTDPVHNLFKDMYRHTDSPNASGSMADSPRAAPAPAPAPYSYKPYSPQPQQTPTSPPSAINYGQSPDSRHQAPRVSNGYEPSGFGQHDYSTPSYGTNPYQAYSAPSQTPSASFSYTPSASTVYEMKPTSPPVEHGMYSSASPVADSQHFMARSDKSSPLSPAYRQNTGSPHIDTSYGHMSQSFDSPRGSPYTSSPKAYAPASSSPAATPPSGYAPVAPPVAASPGSGYTPMSPHFPPPPSAGYTPTSPQFPPPPSSGYTPTSPQFPPPPSAGYTPASPQFPPPPSAGYDPKSPPFPAPPSAGYDPTSPPFPPPPTEETTKPATPPVAPPPPPPPPCPPPPPPKPGQTANSAPPQSQFPTRLDRQLSDMQLSDQQSPLATPTSGLAGGSPYHSYNKEPSYPDAGYRPSPPKSSHHSPQQPSPQAIPDAILNMAAKGEPDKKPWAYAPDMNVIKQQRDKVRRRVPQKDKQDITQSDVYKMIHETGEPKPKPHVIIPQVNHHPARGPSETDETKFSGLNYRGDIPSKSFHRLQQMTSHPEPEIDTSSIRPNMGENDDQKVGNYDETSIRYMGRNIPSKSFRMLQSMTDGNELTVPQAKPRRRPQPEQEEEPQQDADDIVDIKYVGGAIPSKSFRFLQKTVGETQEAEPDLEERRERRRSRSRTRRRSRPREEEKPVPATAGGEQLKIGPESILPEQWQAALPQSVAPQVTVATNVKRSEPEPEEEDEETSTFDERAYLAGKIPLVSEGPGKYVPDEVVADLYSAPEAPTQESPEEKAPEFDEDSYLSGKLTLMSVSGQQGEKAPLEKPKREVTPPPPWIRPDVDKEQTDEQFDEEAYKGGRLNIVRKSIDLALPPRLPVTVTSKATTDRAPWQRDEPDVTIQNDAEFDEHAFLYGSSARSQSVPSNEKSAPWTQKDEKPEEEFDESAYLAGRIPVVRDSVDRELDGVAHKTPKVIPLRRQERAVWQRDEDEDNNDSQDVEFDENAYLAGRLPVVRGASVDRSLDSESSQFKKIPSRSFRRLTRSLSTDCANFMGDNDTNQEEEEDPDTIIRKQVPSKAFRCLTRLVDKKAAENDMLMKPFPIDQFERLREKATADESQMNMDQVLEKMNIENTDPSQYLNQLRTTLEDATARIELENEVTEF